MREDRHARVGALAHRDGRPESVVGAAFADARAEAERQRLHLTGMARRGGAEFGRRLVQHFGAALRVAAVAAGREHDAEPRLHAARDGAACELDAADPAFVREKALHARPGEEGCAALLQGQQEAADERVAHDETRAALAGQPVERVTRQEAQSVSERFARPAKAEQMVDVGAVHHHAAENSELRNRRAHEVECGSKHAPVEGQRLQRAAVERGAFDILLVIGMQLIRPKLDVRLRLERRNGLRGPLRGRLRAAKPARNCRQLRRGNGEPSRDRRPD